MATVDAKLKSAFLAIFLLMFVVRATSAGLPYVAHPGDESGTAEPIVMGSQCDGYPYTAARKLIPCRNLRFVFWRAPPPPERSRQISQHDKAPPPQST